jgi:hypothetical protein
MTATSARAGDPQGHETGCADYHSDPGTGSCPDPADGGTDIPGSREIPEVLTIIRIQEIAKEIKNDRSLEGVNICRILKKIKDAETADGYLPDQHPDSNRVCNGISPTRREWHEGVQGVFNLAPETYPDLDEVQNRTAGVLVPHVKNTGFRPEV